MPKRKRTTRSYAYRRYPTRKRAARRIQRSYRRWKGKRRSLRLRRPTVKSLARSVKNLYKRQDKKYFYLLDNNVAIFQRSAWHVLGNGTPLNACPAVGTPGLQPYNAREQDSTTAHLRNIRIHLDVHAGVNGRNTASREQKVFIALVKTSYGLGSAGGITLPPVDEVFDPASIPPVPTQLAPWECFRTKSGPSSSIFSVFSMLKVWTFTLQPDGFLCSTMQNTSGTSTDAPPAFGEIESTVVGATVVNPNINYAKTHPSTRTIKYTHNCMNAKVEFADIGSATPINNQYYLVALGTSNAPINNYRVSASICTNFVDD